MSETQETGKAPDPWENTLNVVFSVVCVVACVTFFVYDGVSFQRYTDVSCPVKAEMFPVRCPDGKWKLKDVKLADDMPHRPEEGERLRCSWSEVRFYGRRTLVWKQPVCGPYTMFYPE